MIEWEFASWTQARRGARRSGTVFNDNARRRRGATFDDFRPHPRKRSYRADQCARLAAVDRSGKTRTNVVGTVPNSPKGSYGKRLPMSEGVLQIAAAPHTRLGSGRRGHLGSLAQRNVSVVGVALGAGAIALWIQSRVLSKLSFENGSLRRSRHARADARVESELDARARPNRVERTQKP